MTKFNADKLKTGMYGRISAPVIISRAVYEHSQYGAIVKVLKA